MIGRFLLRLSRQPSRAALPALALTFVLASCSDSAATPTPQDPLEQL